MNSITIDSEHDSVDILQIRLKASTTSKRKQIKESTTTGKSVSTENPIEIDDSQDHRLPTTEVVLDIIGHPHCSFELDRLNVLDRKTVINDDILK